MAVPEDKSLQNPLFTKRQNRKRGKEEEENEGFPPDEYKPIHTAFKYDLNGDVVLSDTESSISEDNWVVDESEVNIPRNKKYYICKRKSHTTETNYICTSTTEVWKTNK